MSKLPHLPWKGNPTIGWWQDQKYITLYHGTHVSKIPEIVKSGYIKAPSSGPTAGWVSMALEPNTSHGYAAMSGESAFRAAGASARTVPETERAVLVAKVPVSWALSHMNKEFRGNVDWTKTKLTDKTEYEKWKKSDQEYYAVTELRFPDKFPMSFVVGYMSKKGARIDEELEEEILDETKTAGVVIKNELGKMLNYELSDVKETLASSIHEQLDEGRDAPLYHATSIKSAIDILTSNMLICNTYHNMKKMNFDSGAFPRKNKTPDGTSLTGVSLTRSKKLAFDWYENGIIFELDQSKLTNNHKIIPTNWWHIEKRERQKEFEEFVLGSIKNLNNYLISITINPEVFRMVRNDKTNTFKSNVETILELAKKHGIPVKNRSGKIVDMSTLTEDAPVTNAGGGAIAGIGVGPNGEPPVKRKPKIVSRALFKKLKDARKAGTKVEEVEEYINGCLEADKDAPIIFVNEDDDSPLYWRYGKKV